jgi:4-methylaminobutanoate oxidase (formaldehyde-forming)
MLNVRGGYESDVTVTRIDETQFMIVTGSAQVIRDHDWITRNLDTDAHVTVTDVTNAFAVFGIMGPKARDLLSRVTSDDLSNDAFPFSTSRVISCGEARVRASRLTYVGELGWELYVPVECAVSVYDALVGAGEDSGLVHAGYYALESLRLEKAYRAWGHELTPDDTPYEAGLTFAVDFDKGDFIGREALLPRKDQPRTRRVVQFVLEDPEPVLWGGELILRDGKPVGDLKSAAYGHTLGGAVGLGTVSNEQGVDKAFIEGGSYEIDIAGVRVPARAYLRTPYDPNLERVKA